VATLEDIITDAVVSVLQKKEEDDVIKIGVSARHVHLCQKDLYALFGEGYELHKKKELMGGQFAAEECVTIVSPNLRSIENVRVLGPLRKESQVEISRTDTFKLKNSPPVRPSGELKGAAPIALVGPKGSIFLNECCIIANRHIHLPPSLAEKYGVKDNDFVDVEVQTGKPTLFYDVQVRVHESFTPEMHIDTDDANACALKTGDIIKILTK
jgi:putative phosphotransacetylase